MSCDFVKEVVIKVVAPQNNIVGNISLINFSDIALEFLKKCRGS